MPEIANPVHDDSPEARRYNRVRRWLGIADFALGFVFLVVLLVTGWSGWLRDLAYRMGFQNYSLSVFMYLLFLLIISKVLGIGLDFYGYRLERRYKLSTQRFRAWLWDEVKGFLVGLILGGIVVEVLYSTIREWPQNWWLLAWALFMVLFVLLAQLAPVVLFPIFYKFEPLDNEELRRRLVVLSERAGTRVRGVYRWRLSEKSKKANAALTGLGATRRIILADTLLDNYTSDEIEAVLAHELGHQVHRHILKSIFVQAGITLFGFWAANWTLHYAVDHHMFEFVQLSDFANLPLLALVATVLSLFLMPALNAYSRYNERQADRYAFESIASVEPFISSMNKLAEQNLAERTPAKWVEWFFHSHPSISRRLAAAEEWGKSQSVHMHI
ncbi:MAG TPA: M48 family metallopeptidase [Candidatus Acidoferrum sp.]|jgi:Zn-dependent protease with chaperone function|nr:M48 family metallopeptidase [Candidatus Acidoferrum sp.]